MNARRWSNQHEVAYAPMLHRSEPTTDIFWDSGRRGISFSTGVTSHAGVGTGVAHVISSFTKIIHVVILPIRATGLFFKPG